MVHGRPKFKVNHMSWSCTCTLYMHMYILMCKCTCTTRGPGAVLVTRVKRMAAVEQWTEIAAQTGQLGQGTKGRLKLRNLEFNNGVLEDSRPCTSSGGSVMEFQTVYEGRPNRQWTKAKHNEPISDRIFTYSE